MSSLPSPAALIQACGGLLTPDGCAQLGCDGGPVDPCCDQGEVGHLIVEHVAGSLYRLVTPVSAGWSLTETGGQSGPGGSTTFLVPQASFQNAVGSAVLCSPDPIPDGPFAGKFRASTWTWSRGVHPDLPEDGAATITFTDPPPGPYGAGSYPGRFRSVSIDAGSVTARVHFFESLDDPPASAFAFTQATAEYSAASGTARGIITTSGRGYFGDAAFLNPFCVPPSGASSPIDFTGSRFAATPNITAEATLTVQGQPVLCPGVGLFQPFDCANDEPVAPPPNPECCDPPSASGWAFADSTAHSHGVYALIRRYAGQLLREEWIVDIRDTDEGPPLASNCAGSGSGETVVGSSPDFIARKWTYSDNDPPVPTNLRVVYSAALGESSAHPSGSQTILTIHDGPNASSPVLCRLIHNADGTITRTGTPLTLTGLSVTQGENQAHPAGSVPFWTNLFAQVQSVGGLLPGGEWNWAVDVGHGVSSFGHSRCADLLAFHDASQSQNPATAAAIAAIERHMEPATRCRGCER